MERETPTRLYAALALLLVAVIAAGGYFIHAGPSGPCFTAGSTAYRVAASAWSPDYRVRIDGATAVPDLRIRLVDETDSADFVLVDDPDATGRDSCSGAPALKTVQVVSEAGTGIVTVSLVRDEPADFRLFVRSSRLTRDDAVALLAAMADGRKTELAGVR